MMMPSLCKKVVCFDLDDTLYKEIDFLKSGYRKVTELVEERFCLDADEVYANLLEWYHQGANAFERLNEHYGIDNPIDDYLNVYRYHHPSIMLSKDTKYILNALSEVGCELGIITDGREITQREKIEALGLGEWIPMEMVLINEDKDFFKPNPCSFERMMSRCQEKFPNAELEYYYIGDNTEKDFLAPNRLGWETVCLEDDGRNIHRQDFDTPECYQPKRRIKNIKELSFIYERE